MRARTFMAGLLLVLLGATLGACRGTRLPTPAPETVADVSPDARPVPLPLSLMGSDSDDALPDPVIRVVSRPRRPAPPIPARALPLEPAPRANGAPSTGPTTPSAAPTTGATDEDEWGAFDPPAAEGEAPPSTPGAEDDDEWGAFTPPDEGATSGDDEWGTFTPPGDGGGSGGGDLTPPPLDGSDPDAGDDEWGSFDAPEPGAGGGKDDSASGDETEAEDEDTQDAPRKDRPHAGPHAPFVPVYHDRTCKDGSARLKDAPIPVAVCNVPRRPRPLFEWGQRFQSNGGLREGFRIPTGAVLQPGLLVFGRFRSGLTHARGAQEITEWANRLDLFANLQLSGTERVLVGVRPLDASGTFTGYRVDPDGDVTNGLNARVTTLFFEGDIGELFPRLDPGDQKGIDLGFSVGRQPLRFQDGILLNDDVEALGLTQNSLRPMGWQLSNLRLTGILGWNQIHRGNRARDRGAVLAGFLTEMDAPIGLVELDVASVFSGEGLGDSLHAGVGLTRRIGKIGVTLRANTSLPLDGEQDANARGTLFTAQANWSPPHGYDNVYGALFAGVDRFRSAVRGPTTGGPLAGMGILLASPGLGRAGAPLSNNADHVVGAVLGRQWILAKGRQQVVVEGALRKGTRGDADGSAAVGVRYQRAIGQHLVWLIDGHLGWHEQRGTLSGLRTEILVKF